MMAKMSMLEGVTGTEGVVKGGRGGAAAVTKRGGTGTAGTATVAGSAAKTEMLTGREGIRSANPGVAAYVIVYHALTVKLQCSTDAVLPELHALGTLTAALLCGTTRLMVCASQPASIKVDLTWTYAPFHGFHGPRVSPGASNRPLVLPHKHVTCHAGRSARAPVSLSLRKPSTAATAGATSPGTGPPLTQAPPDSTQGQRSGQSGAPRPPLPPQNPRVWWWSRLSSLRAATHS